MMIAKSYSAGVAFGQTLVPAALAANIREKNETKIGVAALIGGFVYQLVANIASASNLIQSQSLAHSGLQFIISLSFLLLFIGYWSLRMKKWIRNEIIHVIPELQSFHEQDNTIIFLLKDEKDYPQKRLDIKKRREYYSRKLGSKLISRLKEPPADH
jgi:hypothetical protein